MISAGPFGIIVGQDTIFGGRISNSGRISAGLAGIIFSRITAFASSTAGGIVNGGTITAGETGIDVFAAPTFQGGIDNGGTIKAPNGIRLDSVTVFGNASASAGGGITNSGVISGGGSGIALKMVSTFLGAIRNSGTISAATQGIHLSSFGVFGSTSAASGIVNSGRIATQGDGIAAHNSGFNGSAFFGGIRNAGTISAGQSGIFAFRDGAFEGGVTNAGMISAEKTGINVGQEATFGGKISNSGRISAGLEGIFFSRIGAFANSSAGRGRHPGWRRYRHRCGLLPYRRHQQRSDDKQRNNRSWRNYRNERRRGRREWHRH